MRFFLEGNLFLREDMGHKSIRDQKIAQIRASSVSECPQRWPISVLEDETSSRQEKKRDAELICACMYKQSQNLNKHVRESPVSHH